MPSKNLRGLLVEPDGVDAFTVTALHPKDDRWAFRVRYRRVGGRWLRAEVTVGPSRELDGEVTSALLHGVPLQELKAALARYKIDGEDLIPRLTGTTAREFKARPRPGRFGRGDRPYAELAQAYLDLCATSRSPIADLAKREHLAPTTVRDYLAEARSRELLSRPGQGRAGGRLLERGIAVLAEKEGEG